MANEVRLIDANAMHKWVEDKVASKEDGFAYGVPYEWAYALTAVDIQPTVDAVPVVRCKDCKYYCNGWHCNLYLNVSHETKPDDFCSYGERREEDG